MKKDRHSKGYYENYARKHPYWCKAHWYLSVDELLRLRGINNSDFIEKDKYLFLI